MQESQDESTEIPSDIASSTTEDSPSQEESTTDSAESKTDEAAETSDDASGKDKAEKKATKEKAAKKKAAKEKAEKKKAQEVKKTAKEIAQTLAVLTVRLETSSEDLSEINKEIKATKKRIKRIKKQVNATEATLDKANEELNEAVCQMYKTGKVKLMSVLLGATTFEDFASRVYLYEKIVSGWDLTIEAIKQARRNLKEKQDELKHELQQKNDLQIQKQVKGAVIAASIEKQIKLIKGLDRKTLKKVNKKYDKILSEYESAAYKASSAWYKESGKGSTSKKGSHPEIVAIASKYLGVKYVWGGEDPSGFDCSGLTMFCYDQIGIELTHFARTQYDEGKHIAYSALMPGDLVFFGSSVETIHHVGIYIGDGKYIHAPHTGDVVKISKLKNSKSLIGACRPNL